MADVELRVGATRLEFCFSDGGGADADSAPALAVTLPKPVDAGATEAARFNQKSGQLRVSLRVAS